MKGGRCAPHGRAADPRHGARLRCPRRGVDARDERRLERHRSAEPSPTTGFHGVAAQSALEVRCGAISRSTRSSGSSGNGSPSAFARPMRGSCTIATVACNIRRFATRSARWRPGSSRRSSSRAVARLRRCRVLGARLGVVVQSPACARTARTTFPRRSIKRTFIEVERSHCLMSPTRPSRN